MDPLSVIASVIAITGAIATSCKTIGNISGLPKAFRQVQNDLPLVQRILDDASQKLRGVDHTDDQRDAIMAVAKPCLANAEKLKLIFQELESKCKQDEEATWTRARVWYREAIRSLKAHRVESLMSDVLKGVEKLVWNELFRQATQKDVDDIKRAIKELSEVEPSLDDSELANAGVIQASQEIRDGAKGQQNNVQGGTNTFHSGEGHVFTGPMSGVTFDEAAFNTASKQHMPSCLPETRQQLLSEIRAWADGEDERPMYWLKGMAGTGKSTIALTVAREYSKKGHLGASFFFSRGGGDLALSRKFAATIAAQLAEVSPDLRKGISDSVAANPRINSLGLYDQWEKLVLQPLARANDNMALPTLLVVVDALDECENDDDVSLLIQCLTSATSIDGIRLRILITSRPNQSVNFAFDSISAEAHQDFILHDIEQDIVNNDLNEYYKTELADIERRSGLMGCLLSDDTVEVLVKQSCGLFIHAATVCRFIRDGRQLANDRLSLILHAGTSSLKPERELDQMYTTVLTHLFGPHFDPKESATRQSSFRYIVGSIVALLDALSLANLAALLSAENKQMTKEHLVLTLRDLHSVLDVPEQNDRSIRLLHPSFREFLLNPARCLNKAFWINAEDAHGHLFNCCLQIMSNNLRRNMCGLKRPGTRVCDIPKDDVDSAISVPVRYACRYWIHHLQQSNIDPREHVGVVDFFQTRFLFWIETLSLIGRLADGIASVGLLEADLSPRDYSTSVSGIDV
ncbi:hypothetical protein Purlil1_13125 [Purpureocillium lilacinum]|uniref:NACHT domain-containing protein n=1 Tax=Purpureocillium lilacinum TaxID=33203 RepID=A0ABR0BF10_PURLI|nr:hypothetical protein Purlil1_13125 [Purpureocillium lilacinum]